MGIYGGKSGHDRDSNSSICSNSSDDCSDEGGEPSKRGGGGKEGKEGMDGVVVYQHEAGSIQYSPHLTSPHKNEKADLKAKSGKKGKGGKKGRKKGRKSGQVVLVGNHYRNLESFNQSTERKGGGRRRIRGGRRRRRFDSLQALNWGTYADESSPRVLIGVCIVAVCMTQRALTRV